MKNEAPIGMPCSNETLSNPLFTPKNGESIYINDLFVGTFVENLTDYLPGEDEDWRKVNLMFKPFGIFVFSPNSSISYWAKRKVFNRRFGTVNQILVKDITGDDLVWINT